MAYSPLSLRRHTEVPAGLAAGTQTFGRQISMFLYATDDAAATVEAAGYFNGARNVLTLGSVITAAMVLGGTPVLKQYIATSVPATGNVTVALQTATAG